ncbi:MAG: RsmB/NOP family class I SAM-dependent RNA methyltransferase [Hyphomicrobium sp.]
MTSDRSAPPFKAKSGNAAPRRAHGPSGPRPPHSGQLPPLQSGLAARQSAAAAVHGVMFEHRAFDLAFARATDGRALEPRDRAFARAMAGAVLRRHGDLRAVLSTFLERPLPAKEGRAESILLVAAAQLLLLDTPAHAAISMAVDQCRSTRATSRFDKLTNAVLRRVSEKGREAFAATDGVSANIPKWMLERWRKAYGARDAQAIAAASLCEAPLDMTVKVTSDAAQWAERLGGILLPTGTVRLPSGGRIEALEGYDAGAWWVQDAAAALPARLLGDVSSMSVADLCAAPGGKTAQLAAAGAKVVAVDTSTERMQRLEQNLTRLGLTATTVVADVATWSPGQQFDAVLVDAPCTATGTIRRHPDILHLKRATDMAALADVQRGILANAARLVKPGGRIVYCTCSLEPEEGPERIAAFLAETSDFNVMPVTAEQLGGAAEWITADGYLRTLPIHLADLPEGQRGLDGFFAAVLKRNG